MARKVNLDALAYIMGQRILVELGRTQVAGNFFFTCTISNTQVYTGQSGEWKSVSGRGKSISAAQKNYVSQIKGRLLQVKNDHNTSRFNVPDTLTV